MALRKQIAMPLLWRASSLSAVKKSGVRSMSDKPTKIDELSFSTDPIFGFGKLVKEYGFGDVWKQLRQCKEAKVGRLVGTDRFGNRYYENKLEQFNRDRWVVYNTKDQHMDYDPSTVPPEWHGWLHHMTDKLPEQLGDAPIYQEKSSYDTNLKTARDTEYANPGHLYRGKARGDGFSTKTGSVRPVWEEWDPTKQ
mmetsp:Transcript_26854/g.54546  ORF Transcript_26854/g.54546 Transcript_26854/m.54546 type:complete len:195 (-) Transcript_26854:145-729(-)